MSVKSTVEERKLLNMIPLGENTSAQCLCVCMCVCVRVCVHRKKGDVNIGWVC